IIGEIGRKGRPGPAPARPRCLLPPSPPSSFLPSLCVLRAFVVESSWEATMSDRLRFNLHLPGLLKVLAEHLYTSKKVGIRELIQNAHDSCVRRKIEGSEPDYHPRIDITLDTARRTVTIRDNGNGLTAEEIETYLATI